MIMAETGVATSSLEGHRIKDAPASMYYIPDFISAEEEAFILSKIPANRWISLSHRRLQALPARLTASNVLVASAGLPTWLAKPAVERIEALGLLATAPHGINHCLINEYEPGQGIMPHEDGAAYHPVVATVSLGGSIVLDVVEKTRNEREKDERQAWRILQEPRSLLITTGSAYTDTLHGIAEVKEDVDLDETTVANWMLLGDRESITASAGRNERTTRISLTFRDVLKESKVGSKIFGKTKT
ncbi:hypothetical protein BDY17DRAFT_81404 [Neohortaea acidophila]|uniref:Fe2OG dioxygenase domain-containing protein n=1 Tax=Neohortaea acidophila TaxID=245834 RepID=A0A6A6Q229_9PEZI|nr:uncharacterized protein BDY17DRAFT_81404 [Neohortaea acidophila]KAF2486568.1 hypothetical protein BDY17DRAFT_81404 [Neohortaea acidophila]